MPPAFVLHAVAAGLLLALLSGPFGAMVVWRRMAYVGETVAHAALLGVGLSLLLRTAPLWGGAAAGAAVALALGAMQRGENLATDTLLGILSATALAGGLLTFSLVRHPAIDLETLLFGDILAVTGRELAVMAAVAGTALALLLLNWRSLLSLTVHRDLARVEGIAVTALDQLYLVLLALVVAIGLQLVGVLLITAFLIVPAATARPLARSPEVMALLAVLAGSIAIATGLAGSFVWDVPAGPAIVLAAAALFGVSVGIARWLAPR